MSGEALVDVTYRGLEIGRRMKLTQVGPSTAYLEHGTPMPVGSQMELTTDDGLTISAVVLRVHEQVAGAEQAPGMRVRASLEGAATGWWRKLVSCDDPTIPEAQAAPTPRAPVRTAPPDARTVMMGAVEAPPDVEVPADEGDERRTVMMEAQPYDEVEVSPPAVEMEAEEPPLPGEEDAPKTVMMDAVAPPVDEEEPGKGRHPRRTVVMTAVEIDDALASETPGDGAGGNGEGADDGSARGKGGKRRRRRR